MKYLIFVFAISQSVLANFVLIKHSDFLELDAGKQIYYVKTVRSNILKLVNDKKKNSFLQNDKMFFVKTFLNEAIASSDDCIVGGYLAKKDSAGKKCSEQLAEIKQASKCVAAGYVVNNDLASEKCGAQPGVRSPVGIDLSCDSKKVGVENKYPCLPLHIYGFSAKGDAICVSENPRKSGIRYVEACQNGANRYPENTKNAAVLLALNPDNYALLDQYVKEACTSPSANSACAATIARLEEAASYLSVASKGVPGQKDSSGSAVR